MDLPPGVVEESGELFRYVPKTAADGTEWQSRRPVALTVEEARRRRFDYYDEVLGWILEGYKLARDRQPADIVADSSMSMIPPEGQDVLAPVSESPTSEEGESSES